MKKFQNEKNWILFAACWFFCSLAKFPLNKFGWLAKLLISQRERTGCAKSWILVLNLHPALDIPQIFTVHKVSLAGISYLIQERHLWDFRCYRRGDIHGPARSQGGVLCLLSSNKSDVSEDEDDSGDEGDKYYDDLSIMA